MTSDPKTVARQCSELSDREATSFADIVGKLMTAGVERYHADLTRAEKIYYWPDGASERVANAPVSAPFAIEFSAAGIAEAVRGAQAGTVRYKEFCERAARAGCVGYHVHLAGKRVVYYGRDGDSHVEWFPGAQP